MSSSISPRTHYEDRVFEQVQLAQAEVDSSEFHDCTFVDCSFTGSVFRECRFNGCAFRHCDLSLIKLPGSRFSGTGFDRSKVVGVNWTEAKWPDIRLSDPIGFSGCVISHSTFIGLDLKSIKITDCVAEDVDFRETDLSESDFSGTDLSESMFSGTNLSGADLSRARNYRIDARESVLRDAKFSLPEAVSLLEGLGIALVDGEP